MLERYSSAEYMAELRDAWGDMINHVEHSLDDFMCSIPADYRNSELPLTKYKQPRDVSFRSY